MSGVPTKPFVISNRLVLGISVPLTLAYISTPLLGLVDTAVVGQFGTPALIGGLAVGAVIIDLVFATFNFLRGGTSALAAQAYGAGDESEKQAALYRALAIALSSGLVMLLASPLLLWLGLWFMAPPPATAEATRTYFLIRMLSAPFALANFVMLGWILGLGRSGLTLVLQLLLNGTNITLSLYLGLWLEWNIEGVAMATVIGEMVAFAVCLVMCWRLLDHAVRPPMAEILKRQAWFRLMNLNADIMVRSFVLLIAFAYFTAQGAAFGEVTLAANAVLMHLFFLGAYFLDGLATAAEQICGRSVGANYRAGFWKGFRLTLFWNLILAGIATIIFAISGPWLINLLSTNEAVRETANAYLWWATLIPLISVLAFHMDGVFIGATWSRDMSIMMIVSLVIYGLVLMVVKAPLGNHGLWLAIYVFLLFRGITLLFRLRPNVRKTFG
ncbi:MAG: MATE family efflux transporter [Pseudomonadota bacterium]